MRICHGYYLPASALKVLMSVIFAFAALINPHQATAENVTMWVYHDFPPYIVDAQEKDGISFDLAQTLGEMSGGEFQFNVEILPRQRLNDRLTDGKRGLVLWANPIWFEDRMRTKYLWTKPVLSDSNVVISPKTLAFQYDGPQSLNGATFVGVSGHMYEGVDPLVALGHIQRIDLATEGALIRFIASGRGQVAIVADTAAQYFVQELGLQDAVHFSEQPHSTYDRRILVHPELSHVHTFLQGALSQLSQSKNWISSAKSYGLNTVPTP